MHVVKIQTALWLINARAIKYAPPDTMHLDAER